jgi:hypothetical protein
VPTAHIAREQLLPSRERQQRAPPTSGTRLGWISVADATPAAHAAARATRAARATPATE